MTRTSHVRSLKVPFVCVEGVCQGFAAHSASALPSSDANARQESSCLLLALHVERGHPNQSPCARGHLLATSQETTSEGIATAAAAAALAACWYQHQCFRHAAASIPTVSGGDSLRPGARCIRCQCRWKSENRTSHISRGSGRRTERYDPGSLRSGARCRSILCAPAGHPHRTTRR